VDRFYVDVRSWWTMVRLIRHEPDEARRRRMYRTFLLVVPALAAVHTVCFALDPLLFPALRRTEVTKPVFSVGHARSGTTYLHRMMAADPRFSYVLLWEMFFPSLLEKKVLRQVLTIKRVRRRLDALDERMFSRSKGVHESGLFAPEEDDFLLAMSCCSGFWMVQFPYLGVLDFYHVDRWPPRKRKRVMQFYKECLRRQLCLNGGEVHLSKNPVFCGRVEALIETFPDARFVVPVRNPYETIPSLLKLMAMSWSIRKRSPEQVQESLAVLAEASFHNYLHPLEVLDAHPEVPRAVVDYRDLVTDPAGTVRRVYDEIGLDVTPELEKALAEERGREYTSTHSYSLAEFGLEADEIRTRLAPLFERFGWEDARV
jgi:hypothetical protein